jgi:hypothetical protein
VKKDKSECDHCGAEIDTDDALHLLIKSMFIRFDASELHVKDDSFTFCDPTCASRWFRDLVADA